MRGDYAALQTSMYKMKISLEEWESKAHDAEGKNAALERSSSFTKMMDEHNDKMYHVNMAICWKRGVNDAQGLWPDVVNPSLLSYPWQLPIMDPSGKAFGSVPETSCMREPIPGSSSSSSEGGSDEEEDDGGEDSSDELLLWPCMALMAVVSRGSMSDLEGHHGLSSYKQQLICPSVSRAFNPFLKSIKDDSVGNFRFPVCLWVSNGGEAKLYAVIIAILIKQDKSVLNWKSALILKSELKLSELKLSGDIYQKIISGLKETFK
ncbi:hypothetical protein AgCh_023295 [Apium graveolens]